MQILRGKLETLLHIKKFHLSISLERAARNLTEKEFRQRIKTTTMYQCDFWNQRKHRNQPDDGKDTEEGAGILRRVLEYRED